MKKYYVVVRNEEEEKVENTLLDNKQKSGYEEKELRLNFISTIFSFCSIVISALAIFISWDNSKNIADYEFKLSQTPKVCILNKEYQIPIFFDFNSEKISIGTYDGALDFSKISKEYFPIRIPIHNIGVGLAQNCKIKLSASAQKGAALNCWDIFRTYVDQSAFRTVKINEYNYEDFLNAYSFKSNNEDLYMIEWFGSKDGREHYTDLNKDCISVFPYVLPIADENKENYLEIPMELSAFIIEAVRQNMQNSYDEINTPIILELTITYQDLQNESYLSNYLLKFTPVPNTGIPIMEESTIRMQLEAEEIK